MTKPDKSTKPTLVKLNGEVSVQTIQKYYTEVASAIKNNQSVCIKGENISSFDLAAVQLLISAKNEAIAQKKQLTFEIKLPEDLQKIMQNAGFEEYFLK